MPKKLPKNNLNVNDVEETIVETIVKNNALGVFRSVEKAELPRYATSGSGAFDISAVFNENEIIRVFNSRNFEERLKAFVDDGKLKVALPAGFTALIPTKLHFDIPDGYTLMLLPRSSTGLKKGCVMPNSVGFVDSDYTEEVFIMLRNVSSVNVQILDGERIAQGFLQKIDSVLFKELNEKPTQKTERNGGFGSTGK